MVAKESKSLKTASASISVYKALGLKRLSTI